MHIRNVVSTSTHIISQLLSVILANRSPVRCLLANQHRRIYYKSIGNLAGRLLAHINKSLVHRMSQMTLWSSNTPVISIVRPTLSARQTDGRWSNRKRRFGNVFETYTPEKILLLRVCKHAEIVNDARTVINIYTALRPYSALQLRQSDCAASIVWMNTTINVDSYNRAIVISDDR